MKVKRKEIDLQSQVNRVLSDEYLMALAKRTIELAETTYCENHPEKFLPGKVLEIGGAGGVTKSLRPNWIVSDVRKAPGVDVVADGMKLPFQNESFDLIYGVDVLHHISDVPRLLSEIHRTLKPNGIFFVREPYWGIPAQLIWRFFHPEDFSLRRLRKAAVDNSPMSGNQALAWGILRKKRYLPFCFEENFSIVEIGPENGAAFLLSGGATSTSKFPRNFLLFIDSLEKKSKLYLRLFGFATTFYFLREE
jgi:SAM-dependent methyltransferase